MMAGKGSERMSEKDKKQLEKAYEMAKTFDNASINYFAGLADGMAIARENLQESEESKDND